MGRSIFYPYPLTPRMACFHIGGSEFFLPRRRQNLDRSDKFFEGIDRTFRISLFIGHRQKSEGMDHSHLCWGKGVDNKWKVPLNEKLLYFRIKRK